MKRSRRKRQNRTWRRVLEAPPEADLPTVAARAIYDGSPYHKTMLSFAGMPRRRSRPSASICPSELAHSQQQIEQWLRSAIEAGHTGVWDREFPRQVWYREGETVYEALHGGGGHYHGYPLLADEPVEGLP